MNSFESLCYLASKEGWCWKLYCTTCGTMYFRYSFVELAKGKSPEDTDWPISHQTTRSLKELGKLQRVFNDDVKEKVLKLCSISDLDLISTNCEFPDWLGYLGFVLEHMRTNTNTYKLVSNNWASQLLNSVPSGTKSHDRLYEVVKNNEVLLIKDLEVIESDILNQCGNL